MNIGLEFLVQDVVGATSTAERAQNLVAAKFPAGPGNSILHQALGSGYVHCWPLWATMKLHSSESERLNPQPALSVDDDEWNEDGANAAWRWTSKEDLNCVR
jgi:hypothetical protein